MRYDAKRFHLDKKTRTFYVEEPFNPSQLLDSISEYRETHAGTPDDQGTRFMVANSLYLSGQREEAEAEWQTMLDSGDQRLIGLVQRTRQVLIAQNQPPTDDTDKRQN